MDLFISEGGQKSGRGEIVTVEGGKVTLKTKRTDWVFSVESVAFAKELANWEQIFGGKKE